MLLAASPAVASAAPYVGAPITHGPDAVDLEIRVPIQDGDASVSSGGTPGGIDKTGAGVLLLSEHNTFGAGVTLHGGTVQAKYADSLVEVDFQAAEARAGGQALNLTPLEFRLLTAFIRNPSQVLSPDQLLAMAWGDSGFARERVKIYVGYLRSKFRDAGIEDAPIETVRGFGYRYRPPR